MLLSVTESKNIHSELIPQIATGFCGGLSRTNGICGAVSGAIMAINIVYGRKDPSVPVDGSYAKVREMLAGFEAKFGTTNCRQLIDCDLSVPEGRKKFQEYNLKEKCRGFTEEATRLALLILDGSAERAANG